MSSLRRLLRNGQRFTSSIKTFRSLEPIQQQMAADRATLSVVYLSRDHNPM